MILVIHNVEILFSFRLNAFLQEPTTLTTHHRKRKRMMLCSQTVNMFTTGRWRQRFLRSQMTPPVWPTPTSPTKMLSRTTTQASLVPCSSASLVSSKLWICLQFCLIGGKAQNVNCCCLELVNYFWPLFPSLLYSLSFQAVWMSRGSRLASTRSLCSSLGFLMRKRARTKQVATPSTTM